MGSAVALAASLSMTAIVFVLLHGEYAARLADERLPLLKGLGWAWSLSLIGASAFYSELRQLPWRRVPQGLLVSCGALLAWTYWPA
jgi:hypothetical protein